MYHAEPYVKKRPLTSAVRRISGMGITGKPSNSKPESLIADLQLSPTRFGLRPVQMDVALQILLSGGILLENRGTRGNLDSGQHGGSVLNRERYPDFAAFLFLGFDLVALRQTHSELVYGEYHPRVASVVNNIGSSLRNSDLRSAYPGIGDSLIAPDQPANPQKIIRLTTIPFDPRNDMYGKLKDRPTKGDITATLNSGPTVQEIIDRLKRSAFGNL